MLLLLICTIYLQIKLTVQLKNNFIMADIAYVQETGKSSFQDQINKYLKQELLEVSQNFSQNVPLILRLLRQKDKMIKIYEEDIVKYKAQQSKTNKLISQLQQKIAQSAPNSNNTGSCFMLASQFKDYFEDFMKNCLPTCLSPLLSYPLAYKNFTDSILYSVYSQIDKLVNNKIHQICKIINIEQVQSSSSFHSIRSCLLKIMQDNWQRMLQIQTIQTKTSKFIQEVMRFQNDEAKQIVNGQQFKQLDKKIVKICTYMILQQKKWHFQLGQKQKDENTFATRVQKFVKKQHTCIDGWIKQKQDVLVVLDSIYRYGDDNCIIKHANLKNYVIPYVQQQEQYKLIKSDIARQQVSFKRQQNSFKQLVNQPKQHEISSTTQKQKKAKDSRILAQKLQNKQNIDPYQMNYLSKERKLCPEQLDCVSIKQINTNQQSTQLINKCNKQKKQKIETAIRLSKIQQKITNPLIQSLKNMQSQTSLKLKRNDQEEKKTRIRNQPKQDEIQNISAMIQKCSKLKNASRAHNIISDPSFQQIFVMPQRHKQIIQQMPLKRQSSHNKKSCSRKTSAGKIVGQAVQSKQNAGHRQNKDLSIKQKQPSKQMLYRDMIKQKLGGEHKTQRQKTKQAKNKNKQEDRPLRIMHFKKIRQKYLNL